MSRRPSCWTRWCQDCRAEQCSTAVGQVLDFTLNRFNLDLEVGYSEPEAPPARAEPDKSSRMASTSCRIRD